MKTPTGLARRPCGLRPPGIGACRYGEAALGAPALLCPNYDPAKAKAQNVNKSRSLCCRLVIRLNDPARAWCSARSRKVRCGRLSTTHISRRACWSVLQYCFTPGLPCERRRRGAAPAIEGWCFRRARCRNTHLAGRTAQQLGRSPLYRRHAPSCERWSTAPQMQTRRVAPASADLWRGG